MDSHAESPETHEETSEIQQLRDENIYLHETNSNLIKELDDIRNQFNELSTINRSFENYLTENAKLSEEVRTLQNENDDLQRRFNISLKMVDELKNSISQEKGDTKNNIITIIQQKKDKNEINNQLNEISKLKEKLTELADANKQLEADLKTEKDKSCAINDQNDQLLKLIANYFGWNYGKNESNNIFDSPDPKPLVKNVDDVAYFIKEHKTEDNIKKDIEEKCKTEHDAKIQPLLSGLKKMKNKLKKEKALRLKIESDFQNFKEQALKEKETLETEIQLTKQAAFDNDKTFLSQISKMTSATNDIEDKDQKINSLKRKIAILKHQNEELKTKLNSAIAQNSKTEANIVEQLQLKKPNNKKASHPAICFNCEQFKTEVAELTSQNERLVNTQKDFTRSNNNLKHQIETLSDKYQAQSTELYKIRILKEEIEGKYNNLNSQYEAIKVKLDQVHSSNNSYEKSLSHSKSINAHFETLFKDQKEDIATLYEHRNKLADLIYRLRSIIQQEEVIIENLTVENKATKKKLKLSQQQLQQQQQQNKQANQSSLGEEIPATSWFCQDFDPILCDKISEFANNAAFPVTAKLKHIFLTISRHYNSKNKEYEDSISKINQENENFINSVNSFVNLLSTVLNLPNFKENNDLMNPIKVGELINAIKTLINKNKQLNDKNAKLELFLTSLLNKLQVPNTDAINQEIDFMINSNEEKEAKIVLLQKKINRYKKAIKEEKSHYMHLHQENKDLIQKKDQMISDLTQKNEGLSSYLAKTEATTISTIDSKAQAQAQTDKKTKFQITSQKQHINSLNNQIKELNEKNKNEIVQYLNKINELNLQIEKLEKDLSFWKDNAMALKNVQATKEQEIQHLQFEFEKLEDEAKDHHMKEIDQIKKQYEIIIENINNKNLELRKFTDKLTNDFHLNEENVKSLNTQLIELRSEKEQLETKLMKQIENERRVNAIADQKIKASQMLTETKYQNEISSLKKKFEDDKRKLFSYAVKSFSSFFDANENLDEDSFKDTIKRSSYELEKLIGQDKSIRRLLGITPSESPEQTISQLLLTLYHQS